MNLPNFDPQNLPTGFGQGQLLEWAQNQPNVRQALANGYKWLASRRMNQDDQAAREREAALIVAMNQKKPDYTPVIVSAVAVIVAALIASRR